MSSGREFSYRTLITLNTYSLNTYVLSAYLAPGSEANIKKESGRQDRNTHCLQRARGPAEKTGRYYTVWNDSQPGRMEQDGKRFPILRMARSRVVLLSNVVID